MEEVWRADRSRLRQLLADEPHRSLRDVALTLGRSLSWVKKWRRRFREADPDDDSLINGLSRAPHNPPPKIPPEAVEIVLDIRDHPPHNLRRVPGPKAILYYLHNDAQLKQSDLRLPRSTRTVWEILRRNGRIWQPKQKAHRPMERPEPLSSWQIDFKDIAGRVPEAEDKKQHGLEALNVVDVGTSMVLDSQANTHFAAHNALQTLALTLEKHGCPRLMTLDRDPRWVGSWSGRDFPSALVRFILCLGIKVNICPPHRPDLNGFVERFHRSLKEECLWIRQPKTLADAQEALTTYQDHYNRERPNQAITCGNLPPATAFPELPTLPSVPKMIDPDAWLRLIHQRRYARRLNSNGTFQLGKQRYYVKRQLAGQLINVKVDGRQRLLYIEHQEAVIKELPIKGLFNGQMSYVEFVEVMRAEAESEWQRRKWQRR